MSTPNRSRKLTPRQQLFVEQYLLTLNATQAAKRSGYSERRAAELGYQLLRKATVQAAIAAAQQERSKRTEVSADFVIAKLVEEVNRPDDRTSPAARVKALELLARHLGMLVDRHEHQHAGDPGFPIHHSLEAITHDQRIARISEILALANRRRHAGLLDGRGTPRTGPFANGEAES